jgi:hypothetical protein
MIDVIQRLRNQEFNELKGFFTLVLFVRDKMIDTKEIIVVVNYQCRGNQPIYVGVKLSTGDIYALRLTVFNSSYWNPLKICTLTVCKEFVMHL